MQHFQNLTRRPPKALAAAIGDTRASAAIRAAAQPFGTLTSSNLPALLLRPSLPSGAIPSWISTGDFNGDGKIDWMVANAGDNFLTLYLGNGDGTSQLPAIIPVSGQSPVAIAVGDLDGDHNLDVVVAEADSNQLEILFGNGNGTFKTAVQVHLGVSPLGVTIADVNKDGRPDVIIATGSPETINTEFGVLLNNGGGMLGAPIYAANPEPGSLVKGLTVSAGDVNGDGILDLLVYGADPRGTTLESFIGKGDGTFSYKQLIWASQANPVFGNDITAAVWADVNRDGCLDTIVEMTAGNAYVFSNDCSGGFPTVPTLDYGLADGGAGGMALADINGDGFLDLIAGGTPIDTGILGEETGDVLTVRFGDGTGHFGPAHAYRGDPGMVSIAVADLKGTGHPEIITANQEAGTVTVFVNDGSGGFGEPMGGYVGYDEGTGDGPFNAALSKYLAADIDGDGKPDLALLEFPDGGGTSGGLVTLNVMLNEGAGVFSPPIRNPSISPGAGGAPIGWGDISDLLLGDFRKTGQPDFLALIDVTRLLYAKNLGGGHFATPVAIPFSNGGQTNNYMGALAVGDFNRDGNLDFAVASSTGPANSPNQLTIFLGNGAGSFIQQSQTAFGLPVANSELEPAALFVGDGNGDGKPDLYVWLGDNIGGASGKDLLEFMGNGDGTFGAGRDVLQNLNQITVVDLNHDGRPDVIDIQNGAPQGEYASGTSFPAIDIYFGQSDGTFMKPTVYAPFAGTFITGRNYLSFAPFLGDFNGDGYLDIAVFQHQSSGIEFPAWVQFLAGNGDGTFTSAYDQFFLGIGFAPDLAAFNLLGDGRSAFLQTPAFNASYHVIPTTTAPTFQIDFLNMPIFAAADALDITLNVASNTATNITLTASDANVQVPASVTVPAGSSSLKVPITVASGISGRWFSVTGQGNGTTVTAFNYVPPPGTLSAIPASYSISVLGEPEYSPAPGQETVFAATIIAKGTTSNTFQISCGNLPPGASCSNFSPASFFVPPGGSAGAAFVVTTTTQLAPGSYPFTVSATDGTDNVSTTATLNVGDFSIAVSPTSITAPPNGAATFMVSSNPNYGYYQSGTLTCSGLPSGATCASQGQLFQTFGSYSLVVNLAGVAAGTYAFTVTASSNGLVHSATGQLVVHLPDFSIGGAFGNSTSATIRAGGTATYDLGITPIVGLQGSISLSCSGAPPNASCTVPATVTLSGTGLNTFQVTVKTSTASSAPTPGAWHMELSALRIHGYGILIGALLVLLLNNLLTIKRRRAGVRSLLYVAVMLLATALVSCGGGGGGTTSIGNSSTGGSTSNTGTPAGSYTITVTASLGSTVHSIPLTLVVN